MEVFTQYISSGCDYKVVFLGENANAAGANSAAFK
jgi:hypothetical protein